MYGQKFPLPSPCDRPASLGSPPPSARRSGCSERANIISRAAAAGESHLVRGTPLHITRREPGQLVVGRHHKPCPSDTNSPTLLMTPLMGFSPPLHAFALQFDALIPC
ncbi:uncharacterized protein K452DRAFT_286317 [Aplosporella prunicola CBS 121167]|uniref:Uncharacterized protein n=1 Tax=Aplosporella prunicola CBS 121167 TaxID=1176127 RepID=A0A6A6BH56_9PEZI|nr:uncharacterized protein K452DRAFT_286317 [Aplosporella prunicola CBS 121167]KAF2143482.1 hypothetical protein K452DRAFT_286317 [Aplosporella prunicola CBS 121167]